MLAQLTALVANTGFKGFEEPKQPKDYMPSRWAKSSKPTNASSSNGMTLEEQRASVVKTLTGIFGLG